METMTEKLGIFGGTFDPVHLGHMRLAETAVRELNLDRLIFMPNYVSPFKQDKRVSPAADRVAMIEAAIENKPHLEVSTYEIDNEGTSFTFGTLEHIEETTQADLYFLVGFDSLVQLDTWYRGPEILSRWNIVTGRRPGTEDTEGYAHITEFTEKYGARIHLLDVEPFDVSSTEIRQAADAGESMEGMVPEGVATYIREHGLYKAGGGYASSSDRREFCSNRSALEDYMKSALKESRYVHSLGVEKMAAKLARIHGGDVDKAAFAGRYHDIAKCLDYDEMNRCIEKYGIDEKYYGNNALAHSKVAAEMLCREYAVYDEDILNAVRSHTTGRVDMSLLEEIVYVADAIEENRSYPDLPRLQKLAEEDLDAVCLEIMDYAVELIQEKGKILDKETLEAREFIRSRIENR